MAVGVPTPQVHRSPIRVAEEVEANSCQTIKELSNALNQSWTIIQEYLQVSRVNDWFPKANRFTTCNLLLQWHNTEVFVNLLIIGDEK